MLAELIDTSSWTYLQWLAACILAFVVVTVIVVLYRVTRILQMTRKPRYKPNLRPLRRRAPRPRQDD